MSKKLTKYEQQIIAMGNIKSLPPLRFGRFYKIRMNAKEKIKFALYSPFGYISWLESDLPFEPTNMEES